MGWCIMYEILPKNDAQDYNKAKLLYDFALSCFNNINHKEELAYLLNKLDLTQEEVIKAYINYDLDIFSYSNEIYDPLVMRMVLQVHNVLEGSWHIERQKIINDFIKIINPSTIMDIGFGIPSLYIKEALKASSIRMTLTDIADSAINFATILLEVWDPNWRNNLVLLREDMIETSLNPPKHDIYLFQDSIEHVQDPTACLINFVKNSHSEAKFILSLPIGPITPIHFISWDSDKEIVDWLQKCNLRVIMHEQVKVNPAVDLFAEQLDFNYTNMIVVCKKYDLGYN